MSNNSDYYYNSVCTGDFIQLCHGKYEVTGKDNDGVYIDRQGEDAFYSYDELCYEEAEVLKLIPESSIEDLYKVDGNTSDGYHTFNELYHHRAILFSVICNVYEYRCWKSKQHHDGTMYDGMFIVGIDTPQGQATYHYDIDPYWDMFDVEELDKAPEWDGHTPDQAIERIGSLTARRGGTTVRLVKWGNDTYATKVAGFGETDCCAKCCFNTENGDCTIPEGFQGCNLYCNCYYEKVGEI